MKNKKDIFRPIILNFIIAEWGGKKKEKIENRRQSKPWGTDDLRLLNCDFGYMENFKNLSHRHFWRCAHQNKKRNQNEDMRSRKRWSHSRREVEKSLRKYYSGQRTDSSDWSRREEGSGVGIPGEKQNMTISLKMLWTQFSEGMERFDHDLNEVKANVTIEKLLTKPTYCSRK